MTQALQSKISHLSEQAGPFQPGSQPYIHCCGWTSLWQYREPNRQWSHPWAMAEKRDKYDTVLVLIKLTKFSVSVRFRCGWGNLIFLSLFHHFMRYLRTLYIVWSLVRRRVYSASHQALTYVQRSQITQNTLKRCVAVVFIFSIYLYCTVAITPPTIDVTLKDFGRFSHALLSAYNYRQN